MLKTFALHQECFFYSLHYYLSPRKIVIKIGKKKKRKPESSEEESDDDPPPRHSSKDVDSVSIQAFWLSSRLFFQHHLLFHKAEKSRLWENLFSLHANVRVSRVCDRGLEAN